MLGEVTVDLFNKVTCHGVEILSAAAAALVDSGADPRAAIVGWSRSYIKASKTAVEIPYKSGNRSAERRAGITTGGGAPEPKSIEDCSLSTQCDGLPAKSG